MIAPIVTQNLIFHKQFYTISKLVSFSPPIPNLSWWGHPYCHYCGALAPCYSLVQPLPSHWGSSEKSVTLSGHLCTPYHAYISSETLFKDFGSEGRNELIFRYTVLLFHVTAWWARAPQHLCHDWRTSRIHCPYLEMTHQQANNQPGTSAKERRPTVYHKQPLTTISHFLPEHQIPKQTRAIICPMHRWECTCLHTWLNLPILVRENADHFQFIQLFSPSQSFQMIHRENKSCSYTDGFLFINP